MEALFNKIYYMLIKHNKQDIEFKNMISWCEAELLNPKVEETISSEDKIIEINNIKKELEQKFQDYKEYRRVEVIELKTKINDLYPNLWNLAEAKVMTDLIFTGELQ